MWYNIAMITLIAAIGAGAWIGLSKSKRAERIRYEIWKTKMDMGLYI